jgi:hypothetical protein
MRILPFRKFVTYLQISNYVTKNGDCDESDIMVIDKKMIILIKIIKNIVTCRPIARE